MLHTMLLLLCEYTITSQGSYLVKNSLLRNIHNSALQSGVLVSKLFNSYSIYKVAKTVSVKN